MRRKQPLQTPSGNYNINPKLRTRSARGYNKQKEMKSNTEKIKGEKDPESIILSFHMESSATLWNRIFEGFSSEMVLVSRFEGKDRKALEILYRFGSIVAERYGKCAVEPRVYGIVIKKDVSDETEEMINEWMDLMRRLRHEIVGVL